MKPKSSGSPSSVFFYRAHTAMLFMGVSIVVWLFVGQNGDLASRQILDCTDLHMKSVLTHHLLHFNGWHLSFNVLVLLIVGGALETRWGTPRFLCFYMLMMLGTAVTSIAVGELAVVMGFYEVAGPTSYGATGISLACLVIFAVYHRDGEFVGTLPLRHLVWALILVGACGLAYLDGEGGGVAGSLLAPQISGVALGLLYFWLEPIGARRYQNWRRRRLEIENQRLRRIRLQVDELLHKISAQGYDSLTGHEKNFLRHASKHFRNE